VKFHLPGSSIQQRPCQCLLLVGSQHQLLCLPPLSTFRDRRPLRRFGPAFRSAPLRARRPRRHFGVFWRFGLPLWGDLVRFGQVLFIREALHVLTQSPLEHDHSSAAADNRGEWDPCHRCLGCSLAPCPLAPTKRSTARSGPDLMDSVTTNLCATRPLLEKCVSEIYRLALQARPCLALRCRDMCTSALGYSQGRRCVRKSNDGFHLSLLSK
jgi:hypothetical protein